MHLGGISKGLHEKMWECNSIRLLMNLDCKHIPFHMIVLIDTSQTCGCLVIYIILMASYMSEKDDVRTQM